MGEFILTHGDISFQIYFFSHGDDKIRKLVFSVIFCPDEQEIFAYKNKVIEAKEYLTAEE